MSTLDAATIYKRRWWALGVLCFSLLVIGLDNTILNVAIPHLQESLGASNSQLQWIVDGYTIIYAGILLTTGTLGDRFGRKGALAIGLLIFGAGSAASAFATSATMLIITRGIMGIGGATIMPATLSILTNVFRDPKERARAIGVWAGVAGAGIAVGPLLGGLLLQHFWWGSVFLVNVPVVIIAVVGGHFVLPSSKDPDDAAIDPMGAVLSILTLVTLLWGVIEAPSKGWASSTILGAFGLGAVLFAAFIAWELHTPRPMLDLRFFKNPRFSAANIAMVLVFFALFGSSFLITQQLQFVLGYNAFQAGLAMLPIALPLMFLGPLSARLVERFGTKAVVTGGLVAVALGLFWLSRIQYGDNYLHVVFPMLLLAIGMSQVMAPATESIMGSLPRSKAGVGSAMNDTTRQVGGALGVAVIGSVLASVYRPNVTSGLHGTALGKAALLPGATGAHAQQAIDAIRDQIGAASGVVTASAKAGHPLPAVQANQIIDTARHAFLSGFGGAVLVGALVALAGAVVAWFFLPARAVDPSVEHETVDAEAVEPELTSAAAAVTPAVVGSAAEFGEADAGDSDSGQDERERAPAYLGAEA